MSAEESGEMMDVPIAGAGRENPNDGEEMKDMDATDEQKNANEKPKPEIPAKPDKNDEKKYIKELEAKANLAGIQMGQTWYLVNSRWWKSWKEYVAYEIYNYGNGAPPSEINNENLIEPGTDGKLKKSCMEPIDFIVVSEEMWDTLHCWYGGGPAMPRYVIQTGWNASNLVVEVRPLSLKVHKSSTITETIHITISKASKLKDFKTKMCSLMNLDSKEVRLWDFHGSSRYKPLEDLELTLEAAQIIDNQEMLIEEKDENGNFPEVKQKSMSTYSSSSYYSNIPTDKGATGLSNLGNTCFMNSSIQCLSNTAPLTEYFLNNVYKEDVNRDNPLGMKGEIADQYATLIKDLWAGTHSSVAPRDFKWKLERFAPQFSGYQQHDSQELLAFLLDGLHEDLNRVKDKPYRENPEVDERPETDVAKEAWENHKARNNSIIVDWFQSQLRSTLVCPDCKRVSITFDPFMYLSLPLPIKTTKIIPVTIYFLDPTKSPIKFGCTVSKAGSIKELQKYCEDVANLPADSIMIADIYNGRFFKTFMPGESLDSAIQDRDIIWGFETIPEKEDTDMHYHTVMHSKEEKSERSHYSFSSTRNSLFGNPFIISIDNPKTLTYKQLYDKIYVQIEKYLKLPKGKIHRTTEDIYDDDTASDEDNSDQNEEKHSDEEATQPMQIKKKRKIQPLFSLNLADSYGAEKKPLVDDDEPLGLDNLSNICIHWTEEMYSMCFDKEASSTIIEDPSCKVTPEKEADTISLNTCLDLFTTTEKLGPDDPWYCSKCKQFQQATKKFDLWGLPPVLVIHLKRFSFKKSYWREKLETLVNYPIKGLDLTDYVKGPKDNRFIYDLYAVSNHYGSLGGGHYTAYGKNRLNNEWYKFDDSSVSKIEESRVVTSSAYVLFYRRRETIANPETPLSDETTPNGTETMEDN
eukprot:TRINITY_DN7131_c0_g1_i1.p1 TRINITY_DN7131_c0_g1~~TRINITY_DN7131_c0_g1_i1.p1  ORF type:complete len:918 (-),score=273.75 TRINITY_DN7131_c0_g1_i1:43-2796(-)